MRLLKYFFECSFNESEDFKDLDHIIDRFKTKEKQNNIEELIKDLHQIVTMRNYLLANNIMKKYGNRELDNIKEVEKFINYLYDRFLGRTTHVKAVDFEGKYKLIFCPVCTPDSEVATDVEIIDKATVTANNIQIYICKPCKLVWLDENDIRADNAVPYKEFMKANGLKGFWNELKDVDVL